MRTVAAVLFPGFALLDASGPLEVFGDLPDHFQPLTTAVGAGPITSAQGPTLVARFALNRCPISDVLLVPGGPGVRQAVDDPLLIQALNERAARAEVVLGVCTGAALLAKAGLLDGRHATSHKGALPWVAEQGPAVIWERSARWVEDGKFVTSSGVTAGLDAALAVVSRLVGEEAARETAQLIEHERRADPNDDPFAA